MKRKQTITKEDYLRANRKASREMEISMFGHPLQHQRIHKSKKVYDRNKLKAGDKNLPFLLVQTIGIFASRLS
ncbi:MAG: hypothetical protein MJ197_02475 [Bacteroidales bacterium]|nr:hypothetical protein [Bacteroidales bacterium]